MAVLFCCCLASPILSVDSRAQHECVARAEPQGRVRVFIYSTHPVLIYLSAGRWERHQVHLLPGFVPAQYSTTVKAQSDGFSYSLKDNLTLTDFDQSYWRPHSCAVRLDCVCNSLCAQAHLILYLGDSVWNVLFNVFSSSHLEWGRLKHSLFITFFGLLWMESLRCPFFLSLLQNQRKSELYKRSYIRLPQL